MTNKHESLDLEQVEDIDWLKAENERLKKSLENKFSHNEHQTIAFMLGTAQLNFFSGKTTRADFFNELLLISTESLRRKSKTKELNLLQKTMVFLADEVQSKNRLVSVNSTSAINHQPEYPQNTKIEDAPISLFVNADIKKDIREIGKIKDIRVSVIMDDFTYQSYEPEWNIEQLSIYKWKEQLEQFQPHLLFVESAWQGLNKEWERKIANTSDELLSVMDWCKFNNVPTMFWNKEDPIHFETFIHTAKMFDYVFTTDVDCVDRYKALLNHENVYWLPFAAQLQAHNPIEVYAREDAFCFAGAYYLRYPARMLDLENFITTLPTFKPVIIYDRNYYKDDPNYQFPDNFKPFIKGNLPYNEIDKAYKGYNYSINLNSVKSSQGMFARRVFEVLASNTVLVSNYSRAIKMLLGDLVICSDDGLIIAKKLSELENSKSIEKHKLLALRKVLQEHTYSKRAQFIVNKVFGIDFNNQKSIMVFSCIRSTEEAQHIVKLFQNQTLQNKKLVLINVATEKLAIDGCLIMDSLENLFDYLNSNPEIDYVSYFSTNNYYGKNYLLDLYLATSYSIAQIIGKSKRYIMHNNSLMLSNGQLYTKNQNIYLFASILTKSKFLETIQDKKGASSLLLDSIEFHHNTLSIHCFDYCENYTYTDTLSIQEVDSDLNIDVGLSLEDYQNLTNNRLDVGIDLNDAGDISAEMLGRLFTKPKGKSFEFEYIEGGIQIISSLSDGQHDYYYCAKPVDLNELNLASGIKQKVYLDIEIGLNTQLVFKYFDVNHQGLGHEMIPSMKNCEISIPKECCYISLGFRLYGSGQTVIKSLMLRHKINDPSFVLSSKKYLLISNNYPEYTNLYKNAFVHSRVLSYKELGLDIEVFRLRDGQVAYHEFEGISVVTGSKTALRSMIQKNHFDTILVHFLDADMWEVLEDFAENCKIVVWVHGSEIQSWKRREFLYRSESDKEKASIVYEKKAKMWKDIISNLPKNMHFVFVSQYFADEVMQDLGVKIPNDHYSIIPNPIDVKKFSYEHKSSDLRKKILSIRPFSSTVYANDLTVKVILELSKKRFFKDLEFRIIGDGSLFDDLVEPLKKFPNVILEKKFLRQNEIAMLHKAYGVFLCPSRMDTQGVSRDEAMSSGLVPITNSVGAIPEFLVEFQDLLSEPEDVDGLVQKITDLYNNPSLFDKLSPRVSSSVLNRAKSKITEQEIQLIKR